MPSRERGLPWALASAAAFGTSGTFVTSLLRTGWTPGGAVITRIGVAALVLTVPALVQLRGGWGRLRRRLPVVVGYGALAIAGAQLCFFNAVHHLSVAVALLLEYSGVLLVVGWQWLRHGQRPGRLVLGGAGVAVAGLLLVLDVTGGQHVEPVGIAWGLGAAVGLAAYFVLSARTADMPPPLAVSWAGMVVGATLLLLAAAVRVVPLGASAADVTLHHSRMSWLVPVLGMSLVAAAFAYISGIVGTRRLGARLASFVSLTEVLFAALFAWVVLGERLDGVQLAGGAMVVVGIGLVRLGEASAPDTAPAPDAPLPTGSADHEPLPAPQRLECRA